MTELQDGMLKWFLSQVPASDSTVERRLEREPFDFGEYVNAVEKRLLQKNNKLKHRDGSTRR